MVRRFGGSIVTLSEEGAELPLTVHSLHPRTLLLIGWLLATAAPSSPLAAQDRSRMWLGAGIGSAARTDEAGGAALMGELVFQVKHHHFALRALGAADPFSENDDHFGEVGLLYGRTALRKWGHASIAGGLALTAISPCPNGGCTTLGLPVVAEVSARLGPVFGVGLQGFGNLNSRSSYYGFALFLQLGWMP
jgi:hypothetical protein